MTEALFQLVPVYGVWIILAATFLSCLAVPIPSSLIMLAGGAFVASGDLPVLQVVAGAWIGAGLGDQVGYWAGRKGGVRVLQRAERSRHARDIAGKARRLIEAKGGGAVFLSRWLFSPLGPYVNLLAGAGGMMWRRFTLAGALGEAVWVTIYVSLGYSFAGSINRIADLAGNAVGLLSAGLVTILLARAVFRSHSKPQQQAS